jgi:putative GTP pyrophosphokinase
MTVKSDQETTIDPAVLRVELDKYKKLAEALCADLKQLFRQIPKSEKSIHIGYRIKTLDSILNKCSFKKLTDPFQLDDLCGIRCVCDSGPNMMAALKLIQGNERTWRIDEATDHAEAEDPTHFSYRSKHVIIEVHNEESIPYTGLKGYRAEIQIRTQIMNAWAMASHSLDYKGKKLNPYQQRKLARASALLETAEDILDELIRDDKEGE